MAFTEQFKEEYVTEAELAVALGVDTKRLRDLRSHHTNGKQKFITHIKPTSKCILYRTEDVMNWLRDSKLYSFGVAKDDPDE